MNKTRYLILSTIVVVSLTLGNYFNAHASITSMPLQSGTTYYVATTGNDTNVGTQTSPFKTFAKAMSVVSSGDTVQIVPGTYYEQLNISKSGITVIGNGAIIDGQPNALHSGVVISGQQDNVSGIKVTATVSHAIYVTGQNITVSNSEVYNAVTECTSASAQCGSGIKADRGADTVLFQGNYVHDMLMTEGIAVTMAKNVSVINNQVSNTKVGIYIDTSPNAVVNGNFVFCNQAGTTGLAMNEEQYSGWPDSLSNLSMTRNIVSGCAGGIYYYGAGTGVKTADIEYNTIYGVTKSPLYFAQNNNTSVTISHNIFKNIGEWIDAGSTGISIDDNFWISSLPGSYTGTLGAHDKAGNPIWLVTPVWNEQNTFKQASNSPACGYGSWNCSGGTTATATPTASAFPSPTPTQTSVPTQTLTPTPSSVPASPTYTSTVVPSTPTSSPVPASPTYTPTAIPPTSTPSAVPASPTYTATAVSLTPTSQPISQMPIESVYDDINGSFIYSSGWSNISNSRAYDGSYKQTKTPNASVTLQFTGQSLGILYTGGLGFGRMEVYVDGVLAGTINEKSSKRLYQQRWDYSGQLSAGTHTLKLVFNGPSKTLGTLDAVIIR